MTYLYAKEKARSDRKSKLKEFLREERDKNEESETTFKPKTNDYNPSQGNK